MNRHISKKHIHGQKIHEKMLSITNHPVNENQKHNEISSHSCQMATIKKTTNGKCWLGCGEKRTLLQIWWKCKLVYPLWKTITNFLNYVIKNRTTILGSNSTSGDLSKKRKIKAWVLYFYMCAPIFLQHYLQKPRYGSNLCFHC